MNRTYQFMISKLKSNEIIINCLSSIWDGQKKFFLFRINELYYELIGYNFHLINVVLYTTLHYHHHHCNSK
ncbi:hypothetical protein DERF_005606 [Dermatophagoides farinae]|uniref:Uncharacterized protein n=1 Tax=Dermatophagoides farinae TaxID=6954 RepID=A0A922I5Q4_DERFA|nr:hypothetical protein DERF_005606 [Dermatophagoides farinae]